MGSLLPRRLSLLLFGLLPLLGVACGPKRPPSVVVGDPSELTEETLNQLVQHLRPLVEEEAGRKFETPPHARLGRRADLEAILESEFLDSTAGVYHAPEWVLRQLAAEARRAAPGVVGKWGIQTGVLYLAPDAVAQVTTSVGLPRERAGDVARLVLAHEMVHGLQSEVRGWEGLRDLDAVDAMRAVTEGQANFVESRVADRLGLQDARAALDASQGWTEDGPKSPASFELWALYGQGMKFVAWQYAHGGNAQVWKVIAEPPASTSMIFRPATYSPTVSPGDDYTAALDGIEDDLTEGAWVTVVGRVEELSLREDLQGGDPAEVREVLGRLRGGTERRAFRTDRTATLRVMHFEDPAAAKAMVALAAKPRPVEVPEGVQWRDESTPYEDVPADAAVLRVLGPKQMGVGAETREVWLARGDLVVAIRTQGFRPGLRLRTALEDLLGRLPPSPAPGSPG